MKPAIFGLFANSIAFPDLRWTSDEGLSVGRIRIELLSGLTVALALVPEAVAFAFVAGVHPLVGLYAAFLVGLVTALLGGRPGMISGATGALAVVMVALVAQHGVEYLFATVVLMGGAAVVCWCHAMGTVHSLGAASGDAWLCQRLGNCDLFGADDPVQGAGFDRSGRSRRGWWHLVKW